MRTYVFAAARDGDMLLSCVEAPSMIEARTVAVQKAVAHFELDQFKIGFEGEEFDPLSELDGFEIDHIAMFLYERPICPTCNRDEIGVDRDDLRKVTDV